MEKKMKKMFQTTNQIYMIYSWTPQTDGLTLPFRIVEVPLGPGVSENLEFSPPTCGHSYGEDDD